ncbi:MAG TPA: class I SAM-dependent methyltransferase [Stellaceae bacterium]|nr:class I SAM-dependent methyltransferase [Stellaceae bacterium]
MTLLSRLPRPIKTLGRRMTGNFFRNDGGIREGDFEAIRTEIDRIRPRLFIEIGTGTGVSTKRLFSYLDAAGIACDFYTIEIFDRYYQDIKKAVTHPRFHPILGLSVLVEETTDPARSELVAFRGPQNVLRTLLDQELKNRSIDLAFIDSRKGSALAEFKLLAPRLSPDGTIFCHDILNGGKGVEVLEYLQDNEELYRFRVLNTGPDGIIRIHLRSPISGDASRLGVVTHP